MTDGKIPTDILYDLISRFVINIPEDERKNVVRVCFQIEIAFWFYLDFYCTEEYPHLRPVNMKEFTSLVFKHIPDLQPHLKNLDTILAEWKEYKQAVPTYGAIVLDEDMTHVLLVQSFLAKSSWGFPKGKVNEEEPPAKCAVREVFEETGFDISSLIVEDEFIEQTWNEQLTRLYIISGVDRATEFCPRTRMEIKAVEWFPLADLPASKKDATTKIKLGLNPNNFFMVLPFVKRIRRWVFEKQNPHRQRHKSVGDTDVIGRQRNKSVSDVDLQARHRQHQLVSVAQYNEPYEVKLIRQARVHSTPQSAPPRAQGNVRKEKPLFKRQLFTGDDKNGPSRNGSKGNSTHTRNSELPRKEQPFQARAWINFKFDRAPLLAALDAPIVPLGQSVKVN